MIAGGAGGAIRLSAVSVWEIALLTDSRRIELDVPIEEWVLHFLQRPGIEAVGLTHRTAARSDDFYQLEHHDLADRPLISTAIELACPLVTYDDRILRFAVDYGRQYGFAASG